VGGGAARIHHTVVIVGRGERVVVRKDVTWVDDNVSALLFPPASTDV
jgi:hypothetical protein